MIAAKIVGVLNFFKMSWLFFLFFHPGTEDDCAARLNSLTSAAHGSEVPSKGNVAGNGKKGKNVLGEPVTFPCMYFTMPRFSCFFVEFI